MAPEGPELPEQLNVVETPTSPSSELALSRFEFETGKGNEGTKILMIEWDASVFGRSSAGAAKDGVDAKKESSSDWDILWEGKGDVLPIRDTESDPSLNTRRLYFLLPPGSTVPPLITIAPKGGAAVPNGTVLRTKPLPAIFPAELGGGREAGQRGVLHTIWAKKRLAELQAEITEEMKANGESVGLEMAMQERQRIVDHFGLAPGQDIPKPTRLHIPQASVGPASPRSPIGGKLGEKLRGLKLATSPSELAAATQASKSAHPRTQTLTTNLPANPAGMAVSALPNLGGRLLAKDAGTGGVASLDAIVGSGLPRTTRDGGDDTTEEDLFALPMSPRSPEMKRSPFSLL
ncbi:hypothetical protein QBC37DRAFT_59625 [Rhypophila decipiens]|uniref:Uncharacterized protein n=1 Tax=Rhypophila decipiens TaxID=261697 RepID=A0AAN6Y0L9_9PEZI|nr:hypothetical protein QBC37DRAFT_59625 [Rhypophila decipiens]